MWQSSALVSPTGDDIEPIAAPREDVEMENDEDDEPLEAEVPRGQEHEESCVDIKGLVLSTSAAHVSLEGDAHIPMAVIVCGG